MKNSVKETQYPVEFVESLVLSGEETIEKQLKKNQASQQVIDLVLQTVNLARYAEQKRSNCVSETLAKEVEENLPAYLENILASGGVLYNTEARKPID